jgi:hypothetical protein
MRSLRRDRVPDYASGAALMVTTHSNTCDKCKRVNPISFTVEPEEAWRTVVLDRWRRNCPSCFEQLAEQARVHYNFQKP